MGCQLKVENNPSGMYLTVQHNTSEPLLTYGGAEMDRPINGLRTTLMILDGLSSVGLWKYMRLVSVRTHQRFSQRSVSRRFRR